MPWQTPDIENDEDAVTDRIIDGLADRLPGWEPVEGAPEVALAAELGREIALLNQATVDVLELAVAGVGETAFRFPAYLGAAAEIEVDLEVTGPGVTVAAGFTVAGVNDNGDEVAFELPADVVSDDTTVHVTMVALDEGDAGNTVPAGDLVLVTATTDVISAEATAPSSNGADPEALTDYLGRFVDYLATLRPGGVNAGDIGALARSVPGVYRALAIDLYDPADPDTPSERTVTVFPVDEGNHAVDGDVADQVQALLESVREVNFIVHVAEPTYTPVYVEYAVVGEADEDPAIVEAAVNGAIADWLNGFGSTSANPEAWIPTGTLRLLDLARVVGNATGVAAVLSLYLNGDSVDLYLGGVAPLPAPLDADDPSTISGYVT